MADPRDRLVRSALKPPRLALDAGRKVAGVVTGTELGKMLRGGVKFPNPPRSRRQTSYLAGTPRPRPRGARAYTKGAGRPD